MPLYAASRQWRDRRWTDFPTQRRWVIVHLLNEYATN
jgi:hypothetical protein